MNYKPLGRTGLNVSVVGFGASPLGNVFGEIDTDEGQRAVDTAIEGGINYFDVAPFYGLTLAETRLGKYLKGKRDRIILATKVCRYGWNLEDYDASPERMYKSVNESLKRLRTDRIDVLQIHDVEFGNTDYIIEQTLPALIKLKEQGKIRFAGITGYPLHLLKTIAETGLVDTILTWAHYNLMNTTMDQVLTPFTKEKGIGLINASPLHCRVLTDKGAPDWHWASKEILEIGKKAADWGRDNGIDIADLAMQFALDHPHVATTLVGMSKTKHVESNLKWVGVKPDQEILKEVMKIIEPVKDINWVTGRLENNDPGSIDMKS
jgi:L-galactose dehydrogenase